MRTVVVVPYDPAWVALYEQESGQLRVALGDGLVRIHHIGSTSIIGIHAKPIVDILVEAHSLDAIDDRNEKMLALGYEAMGEYGIPARRYFRKNDARGERQFHVHAFIEGSIDAVRHLAFRDFMNAHPQHAEDYSQLKQALARRHPDSIENYMDGKDAFIKQMQQRALDWTESQP